MSTLTNIDVRVIAKGGKFLGDDVGGAIVTIKNAQTGELLASGNTSGGSGDVNLMNISINRTQTYPTDDASAFSAAIPLDEPCLLEVTAWGPKGGLQSANKVTATQWMVPGLDITGGDGLLLEIPGLMVQAMQPATHTNLTAAATNTVNFLANVTMMCGCPIAVGTPWDPSLFQVGVLVQQLGGTVTAEFPLTYTGTTSQFSGSYTIPGPGNYSAVIYAYQPGNGNSGMARVSFFTLPA
jgi:hypothetical protein